MVTGRAAAPCTASINISSDQEKSANIELSIGASFWNSFAQAEVDAAPRLRVVGRIGGHIPQKKKGTAFMCFYRIDRPRLPIDWVERRTLFGFH